MKSFAILAALVTMIVSPIWRGYAFSKLWLWFIVSTFGAVPLGIAQAIGLALVVSFLTHQPDTYQDKNQTGTERLITAVIIAFLSPAVALLFGFIVKSWL